VTLYSGVNFIALPEKRVTNPNPMTLHKELSAISANIKWGKISINFL